VAGDPQYYRPEGVGVFPLNYAARLRTVLEVQAKRDRRHIPPVYFWRLLTPTEQGTGAAPDDNYFEEPLIHRRFSKRVAAHLYVDDSGETKGAKRGFVETAGDCRIEMSRAECERLAKLFGIAVDDAGNAVGTTPFYAPQPGDLFYYKGVWFSVHQMTDEDHLGPTGIPTMWKGTASQLKDDATVPVISERPDLGVPQDPPGRPQPEIPRQPVGEDEIVWPG
jgi:hypothetical protein